MGRLLKIAIYWLLITAISVAGRLAKFLPTKSQQVLFSQAGGRYNGNSRYLFEYLCEQKCDVRWLYDSISQFKKIPSCYQKNAIKRTSCKGLFCAISARQFVISYGGSDFGYLWFFVRHRFVLGLWHAITVKHIALLDAKFTNSMADKYLKRETKYYDAQLSSSDIDRYVTCAAHGIDIRKVYATGLPKVDQYVRSNAKRTTKINVNGIVKILYAPTFRDYADVGNLFFRFSDFDITQLQYFFARNQCVQIYLRPHPGDLESNQQAQALASQFSENIVYYSQEICDDIDEVLYQFDTIISDYSSIYVEPLLGDTPCIFVPFDYDKYMATRGLAYDYHMVTPGPKVNSFAEFSQALDEALQGAPKWAEKRQLVADIFFKYKDDGACRRIAEEVLGLKPRNLTQKRIQL